MLRLLWGVLADLFRNRPYGRSGGRASEASRDAGLFCIRWLKRNGYPAGYQVLCFNCNFAKHRKGACPHTRALHTNSATSQTA